ncbi:pyridoxal phosphate-dependent decarboxylase family protein [Nocardioides zeae]
MNGDDVLARLAELQQGDLPTHGGRTLAYVYDSGLAEVDRVGREAVAAYAATNGLDPTAFPSTLTMENEVVGLTADLLGAPDTVVGTVTSGGTESVLLAVQGARDARPEVTAPRMVLPSTVHAAFLKAAHYFGVEAVVVPVGPDHRADVAATRAAVEADPARTVLVVASAPSYAHGVVDPVTDLAAIAAEHGIRCHVDACIGGGCCRTPRAWAATYRRGRSPCPGSRASRWTCTSTRTPRRGRRCCCTARRSSGARSSSRRRTGRATRCSTRRCSRPSRAARSRAPGRCCARSATRATSS